MIWPQLGQWGVYGLVLLLEAHGGCNCVILRISIIIGTYHDAWNGIPYKVFGIILGSKQRYKPHELYG